MPARLSTKICPRCHESGGFPSERYVKYEINIPGRSKITKTSIAWDYAARVCLKMAETLMLFPPDSSLSLRLSNDVYEYWKQITYHSDTEIKLFQARLANVVPKSLISRRKKLTSEYTRKREFFDKSEKNIKDPIHVRLPPASGTPSLASISCVYIACICLVLRDLFEMFEIIDPEDDSQLTKGIFTFFSIYQSFQDLRGYESWPGYFRIYNRGVNLSHRKLARSAIQVTDLCRHCYEKQKIVHMYRLRETKIWECPQCGGKDPIVNHFSTRHLKNKRIQVEQKAFDIVESVPRTFDILNLFSEIVKKSNTLIADFKYMFNKYASEAERGILLGTKRYFWGHYDNTKRSKRKWCSLTWKQAQIAELIILSGSRAYS